MKSEDFSEIFKEYAHLYFDLEHLWNVGQGESEFADQLRDTMTDLWYGMTGEEMDYVNSGKLLEERI